MPRTLQEEIENLHELFGDRNDVYLSNFGIRFAFVRDAVRYVHKLVRRGVDDKKILGGAMRSVFARTSALASFSGNLPIVEAISRKYPSGKCGWCQQTSCTCALARKDEIILAPVDPKQLLYGIDEWITQQDSRYGANNRARGNPLAALRLSEEVDEIGQTQLVNIYDHRLSLPETQMIMAREFADTYAWTFSICGMWGIPLAAELDEKYGGVHERCNSRPCKCTNVSWYMEQNEMASTLTPG